VKLANVSGRSEQRWSTRSDWFDWLISAIAGLLGAATVWIGSAVLAGSYDLLLASMAWAFAGVLWSLALILRMTDTIARLAALALLVGALATVQTFGPIMALSFVGPTLGLLGAVVALGLLIVIFVRQRPARIIWLLAPALTVAAFALDLSGIPQRLRFATAEPALAAYVKTSGPGRRRSLTMTNTSLSRSPASRSSRCSWRRVRSGLSPPTWASLGTMRPGSPTWTTSRDRGMSGTRTEQMTLGNAD
jgi:hypothetical protein